MRQLSAAELERPVNLARAVKAIAIGMWFLSLSLSPDIYGASSPQPVRMIAAASSFATGQTQQAEVRELRPGTVVERELKGDESHRYSLALKAGEYTNVVVVQPGLDVGIQVLDSASRVIASADRGGRGFTESVWAEATAGGDYQIVVRGSDEKSATGIYRIKIEKLGTVQTASTRERDLLLAYKTMREADELRDQERQHLIKRR